MSDEVREYQATIRRIRSESERFLKRSEKLRDRLRDAGNDITCLRAEVLEQARLLGISGEREAKLRARVNELESLARELAEGDASRDEIARYRAGLQRIVEGDGFWDAPSIARDLLAGKDVT